MLTAAVRWTMAWACYWVGHVVYLCFDRWHDLLPERWRFAEGVLPFGYGLYSRLMGWSDWWQGETPYGPWKPADEATDAI